MRSKSSHWQEGLATIEAILRHNHPDAKIHAAEWSPSYFATVAARICLSHGDRERAKNLIRLGLEKDAKAEELLYLHRILERELTGPVRMAARQ